MNRQISKQFLTYVLLGLFTNVMFYLVYLLITWLGMEHKVAMTMVSFVGGLQSYYLNKNLTFQHKGPGKGALIRYISAYALIYVLNFMSLLICVDYLLYPHQIVQAVTLIFLALLMYVLQRIWIFPQKQLKVC